MKAKDKGKRQENLVEAGQKSNRRREVNQSPGIKFFVTNHAIKQRKQGEGRLRKRPWNQSRVGELKLLRPLHPT